MFRKIVVPLAGVDSDSAAVDAALLLGREFEAHVEAFYAMTAGDEHPIGDLIERAGFMEAGRVRALFSNRCKSHGIEELGDKTTDRLSADFLELRGIEADLIAEHGRVSDLIVLSHPGLSDSHWPNLSIQTALRETARPVLLVPQAMEQIGKHNVIAWNGSLEATRAIACAIPILLRGESTLVVTIGNHDIQPSGNKVVDYLRWHGIEAKSTVIPVDKSSESSTLLAASLKAGADLVILGAYTRYRTGRPAFSSMTTEMITQNKIPVFMAH